MDCRWKYHRRVTVNSPPSSRASKKEEITKLDREPMVGQKRENVTKLQQKVYQIQYQIKFSLSHRKNATTITLLFQLVEEQSANYALKATKN